MSLIDLPPFLDTMTATIVPTHLSAPTLKPGTDCRHAFQAAYENRYTWD